MPTGYTAAVQDGNITEFRDFAMQCARAFGALVMMLDSSFDAPVPERFEPQTSYHDAEITKAEARIAELRSISPAGASTAAEAAHAAALTSWTERQDVKRLHRERYQAMLAKVERWEPPTADHRPMKSFMAEQLRESIDFDTSPSRFDLAPVSVSGAEWQAAELHEAERSLNYHTEERAKEIARTASRNQWIADLRHSLADARS